MILETCITMGICAGAFVAWKIRQIRKRNLKVPAKAIYLDQVPAVDPKKAPNIVVVLCDDLGYGDIGCFGSRVVKTPNVDALASQGMKLVDCQSSAPVCSPSRAGLLTGRYGVRGHAPMVFFPHGIISLALSVSLYSWGVMGLAPDEITIPEVLRRAGYRTGMVGKWHLGDKLPHLPNYFGFDFFYGAHYSNDMSPYRIYRNDKVEIPAPADLNTLTQHLNKEAVAFIEENNDKPFFLYYAQPFPHTPFRASDAFRGKSAGGLYGDAVEELDWSLGEVVAALKKHGIFDNTLIIFTSDNGPWHEGSPGYQRGRKALPYEGGTRVPMVACWPARIPPGMTCKVPCSHLDLLPTFLSLLGIPLPQDRVLDGQDISGLLADPVGACGEHKPYFHIVGKSAQAVRKGKWKYHKRHLSDNAAYFVLRPGPFLFDMETDPQESYNTAMNHPGLAEEMAGELGRFNAALKKNQRGWTREQGTK